MERCESDCRKHHFKAELLKLYARSGDAPKYFDAHRELSHRALVEEAAALAVSLRKSCDLPDRIGIFLPNSIGFMTAFFAIQMLGKTCLPLNVLLAPRELEMIVEDSGLSLVITSSHSQAFFHQLSPDVSSGLQVLSLDRILHHLGETCSPVERSALLDEPCPGTCDDIAALLYTSGTTGKPKGVMLTQANLITNAYASAHALVVTESDVCYMVLPLFHSFGLTMTVMMTLFGGAVIFEAKFSPSAALHALGARGVSCIFITPSLCAMLLRSHELSAETCPSLRVALSGGAPLPVTLQRAWRERTGRVLLNGYGQSETSPVITFNRLDAWREGSIGLPLENVEVQIRDAQGRALEVRQIGELCTRGPNVMKGYYRKPAETGDVLSADGWLSTGDLGFMDEHGFVFLTGRKRELIICAGENIFPPEVEHALLEHPAIAEAAVAGVPDKLKGEVAKAFLVSKEGASVTERELREFLRPRLAVFKIPREFEFVEALPKNSLGKILKRELVGAGG